MMNYKVKVKKISVVTEAGDRVIVIRCFLIDSNGTIFIPSTSGELGFDIRVPKSSMPNPVTATYLINLVKAQIVVNYNNYLTVTSTPVQSSNKLDFSSANISKLFIGLTITGPGLFPLTTYTGTTTNTSSTITAMSSTTNIHAGMLVTGIGITTGTTVISTTINTVTISQPATASGSAVSFIFTDTVTSITSPTEVQISSGINLQVIGTTTAPSFSLTGTTTTGGSLSANTTITGLTPNTSNIVLGMNITGTGIPYGTTVLSIVSSSSITISQQATASGTTTLTFSTNPASAYLTASTSYFISTIYEGLTITGSSIPRNTTISQVQSPTSILLSNNATGTSSLATYSISGSPVYYFDASNLSLDTTEVANLLNIITFSNL